MKDLIIMGFVSIVVCLATAHGQRCSLSSEACSDGVSEQLKREVRSLKIPDVRVLKFTFSKIHVTHFDIGPMVQGCNVVKIGSKYSMKLSDISFGIKADWQRKRLFKTRRGTLDVSASDSVLTISLDTDFEGCPTTSNFVCDFELNNFKVDIKGKRFGVVAKMILPGKLRSIIRDQVCGQVQQILSEF